MPAAPTNPSPGVRWAPQQQDQAVAWVLHPGTEERGTADSAEAQGSVCSSGIWRRVALGST